MASLGKSRIGKLIAVIISAALVFSFTPIVKPPVAMAASGGSKPTISVTRAATGKVTVKKGTTYNLGAKSAGAKMTYKSSKPSVLKSVGKGKFKAVKAGKANVTITAKKGNSKTTKKIKVTVVNAKKFKKVKSINVKATSTKLNVGKSATLKTTFKPGKASNKNLLYKSSNTGVVTVNATGKVTAKKAGTAKVTVTSVDNKKAKKTLTFKVKPATGDASKVDDSVDDDAKDNDGDGASEDPAYDDPEVTKPEEVDPNHANIVDYDDDVKFVSDGNWEIADDGTVTVDSESLPSNLVAGDVVMLEPTEENPTGYSIVVGEDGVYGNSIKGQQPSLDELFDEIDVEAIGGVEADGFVPEPDVEIESVETVDIDSPEAAPTTEIKTQSVKGTQSTGKLMAASAPQLLTTQALKPSGKTSKFKVKVGDISFSVEPSVTTKLKYNKSGIQLIYLAVNLKEELGVKVKASDLFNAGKVEKKLGSLFFPTSVPGFSVETALYLNISADGTLTFSLKADSTVGFSYKNKKWELITESKASKASIEAKAELKAGLDVTPSLNMWGLTVVDASVSGDLKLGTSSKDVKTRSNGMVCSDFKLKFGTKIEVGKHDSLMKTMFNLSWEKELFEPITLKNWHMENGRFVKACTWKESGGGSRGDNYDDCNDLIIKDPEMPTIQETIERDFTLPTDKSVVWVPITTATDCAGIEVTITDPEDGAFDAALSYGAFTGTGDDAKCVAEQGISMSASNAISKDSTKTLGLNDAGTYYLRITNACYVNPYYYSTDNTNVNTLHLKVNVLNNDANENNDDYTRATQIKRGDGTMFRLLGKEDIDVFAFKAPSSGKVTINIWGQNERFDSKIGYTVFGMNEDGTTNSIGNLGVSSYASYAFNYPAVKTFDIPSAGIYYVKVANAYVWNRYYYSAGADNKTPLYISYDFVGAEEVAAATI